MGWDSDDEDKQRSGPRDKFPRERVDHGGSGTSGSTTMTSPTGPGAAPMASPNVPRAPSGTSTTAARQGSAGAPSQGARPTGTSSGVGSRATPVDRGDSRKRGRDWEDNDLAIAGTRPAARMEGGAGALTAPTMMTIKQFLATQDDTISDEDAIAKYQEYKLEFRRQQLHSFFVAHKEEEWFKLKYHPDDSVKQKTKYTAAVKNRLQAFERLDKLGWVDAAVLDEGNEDNIVRLLDAAVVLLEGGDDKDLATLDPLAFKNVDADKKGKKKVGKTSSVKQELDNGDNEEMDVPKKDAGDNSEEEEPPKPDTEEEDEEKPETNGQSPDGGGGDDEAVKEPKPKRVRLGKDEEGACSESDSDDDKSQKTKAKGTDEKEENTTADESADSEGKSGSQKEQMLLHKTSSIFLRNIAPAITVGELETIASRYPGFLRVALAEPMPDRRFYRRGWITFKRDTKAIKDICWELNSTRVRDSELGAIMNKDLTRKCRTTDGVTLHRSVATNDLRHAARLISVYDAKHGLWAPEPEQPPPAATGPDGADAKPPAEDDGLPAIQQPGADGDSEMKEETEDHPVESKDKLVDTQASTDVDGDQQIKTEASASSIQPPGTAPGSETGSGNPVQNSGDRLPVGPAGSFNSRNPLLQNITDWLIEEASAEEDELLGINTGSSGDGSGERLGLDRCAALLAVLDRLILYLRIVHSVDYYNRGEYPAEDEMPNRCGLIHIRSAVRPGDFGPEPNQSGQPQFPLQRPGGGSAGASVTIPVAYINEYVRVFEQKLEPLLTSNEWTSEAEALKLGKKDPEAEAEAFIAANCQELGKDKWLCPLSGKKFKGPEFVRKHIYNKHNDKIVEVRAEVAYFNNYLADPRRPVLPEAPKPTSVPQTGPGVGNAGNNSMGGPSGYGDNRGGYGDRGGPPPGGDRASGYDRRGGGDSGWNRGGGDDRGGGSYGGDRSRDWDRGGGGGGGGDDGGGRGYGGGTYRNSAGGGYAARQYGATAGGGARTGAYRDFSGGGGGYRRDDYGGNRYGNRGPPPPPPAGGGGRRDPRELRTYHDLDAPSDDPF